MGGAALFFYLQRTEVLHRYRAVLTLAGIVTSIACFNYYMLLESWAGAFINVGGVIKSTGHVYNEAYRYADWLLTVPILMVELVLVIDLPRRQAFVRSFILGTLAAEMIVLGYPGQVSSDSGTRWLWWGASMIPFLIIIYQLYVTLAEAVRSQPEEARGLVISARFLAMLIWCVYPVIYTLPMLGLTGTNTFIATQIGYALADVSAKAIYGLLIYQIALRKSQIVEPSLAMAKSRA
jgi:bacteriorhodopsin